MRLDAPMKNHIKKYINTSVHKRMDGAAIKTRRFLSVGAAAEFTGLDVQTLRKFADTKKIKCYRTPSGQRRFDRHSLEAMCDLAPLGKEGPEGEKHNFLYARVSSKKQLDDLSRQVEFIRSGDPRYATFEVVSDVASGINFKRKGLSTILDACVQGTVGEVVVAHRDRLSRFGFDLIDSVVNKAGGKITVLDDHKNKSTEQELSEDLLSIVHIYCCRQMGKRSYIRRRKRDPDQVSEAEGQPDGTSEEAD